MNNKSASIWFIFTTVVIDMIGVGLIVPVLPQTLQRFIADPQLSSQYFGYFVATYAILQFLFSPLLGMLSDRFGRRPVLLLSLLVAAIDYVIMAAAPELWILFLGRLISGATGANFTVAMAYIADISSDEKRSANFGMVGAAFGLGFIIGPAIGGMLGAFGVNAPFYAAAILNGLNFIFGLFVLPESLPAQSRKSQIAWKELNPFKSLSKILGYGGIFGLLIAHFCMNLAGMTHPSIWSLYTQYKFNWTTSEIGLSLAAVGICSAVAQGFLTRLLIPKLGDRGAVVWGLFGNALSYLGFAFASQGWMVYAVLIIACPFWIGPPALQSMIASKGDQASRGELQGAVMSLTSLTTILNPLIVTQLFAYFTSTQAPVQFAGAPYLFAGVISIIGGLIFLYAIRREEKRKEQDELVTASDLR